MSEEKQENNFSGSNCVIHDDDHGWGGDWHDEIPTEKKVKTKKEPVQDEPMNWPFNRYRL